MTTSFLPNLPVFVVKSPCSVGYLFFCGVPKSDSGPPTYCYYCGRSSDSCLRLDNFFSMVDSRRLNVEVGTC